MARPTVTRATGNTSAPHVDGIVATTAPDAKELAADPQLYAETVDGDVVDAGSVQAEPSVEQKFLISAGTLVALADDDTPANNSSPVVTATLEDENTDPIEGVEVKFSHTGVNEGTTPPIVAYAVTDEDGLATYTYVADVAGVDTVVATVPGTDATSTEVLTVSA